MQQPLQSLYATTPTQTPASTASIRPTHKPMKLHLFLKRPEWLALLLGLVFGACNLILTPPFQAPDEDNRFFRSYHVADGNFLGEKTNQRVGGTIPVSLVETAERFRHLRARPHSKTTAQEIKAAFEVELMPANEAFYDFPNSAIYPPVLFAPQALAIFLFKPFHLSPLALLYVARVASLLFWLCALVFAIRIIPFQRELLLLLGLLPMSTFMHASCSADVVPDALGFLSIAVVFRAIYRTSKLQKWELLSLGGFAIALASAKLVYVPVFLLLAFVPAARFGSGMRKWTTLGALGGIALGAIASWSLLMNDLYTPYSEYNPRSKTSYHSWPAPT